MNTHDQSLFNETSERAVLDYLLLRPERFRTCNLSSADFGATGNRTVFELMNRLDDAEALDPEVLLRELPDEHKGAW